MSYKPVDTAIVMTVGPCIDDTDFKSLEESIAYNAAGMDISLIVEKTDGTTTVTAITLTTGGTSDWTHKDGGYYEVEITAAQNAEEGIAYLRGVCTGVLPFESPRYDIVTANIYDSWIKGTDVLQVDVTQILGHLLTQTGTQLADGFEKFFDVGTPTGTVNSLPAGAADAAGGLPISDVGGLDLDTKLANTNEITAARMDALTDWINGGRLDLILDIIAADTTTDIPALIATAQADLDTITGTDGVTLATAQGLYAPNVVVPDAAGIAPTAVENRQEIDSNSTQLAAILSKLLKYVQLLARSDAAIATDNATELTAINADGGSGGGDFTNQSDAIEALRDRGDSAWTTGAGGSDRLLMVDTTIATLASQTSFTLTAGSADDNAYLNCTIVIEDASTAVQKAVGIISAYTGATKTITLKYDPAIFTIATTDKVYILAENALKSTLANRQLNVAADGDIAGNVDGSVASLVGHTVQTGDSFPRIGAAGASLIDLGGMSTGMKAEVESEANDALVAQKLDHLVAVADADDPVNDSIVAKLAASDGDWSGFDKATDALEALRDRGDAAWTTGAGGTPPTTLQNTTIATLSTQTSFTLTAGSADDDAYNGCIAVVEDSVTATQKCIGRILDYTGGTKTVALEADPGVFTIAAGDTIDIVAVEKTWDAATKALTDKAGFSLAADQSGVTTGTVNALGAQAKLDVNAEADTALTDYGANTTVPDVAGTAATLHGVTDGKIDTNKSELDGLQGTDGKALISTDAQDLSASLIVDAEDSVCDALLTGTSHNIATSLGKRIKELGAYHVSSGTAQGGAAHSITLAADAGAIDHILNRNLIVIQAGTGAGQTRTIVDYDGTAKIAVVDRDWWVNPDATSEYSILPDDTPLVADHGVALAGSNSTITLRADAAATSSVYTNIIIYIMAGTGAGQARLINVYDGATKIATIYGTWTINPDTTSVYCMIASGLGYVTDINAESLAKINTECDTALTDYDPPTRTEATSDKDAIITEVDANEAKIDTMQGNVTDILTDTNATIPGTITTLQTDSTAIKAKTDALPSGITKNVALSDFNFYMVLSSDHVTEATGKTVVGTISKDGGAFVALTNSIAEIASGMYKVDLTQAEMNADVVTLKFTETDCDQRIITIYTS